MLGYYCKRAGSERLGRRGHLGGVSLLPVHLKRLTGAETLQTRLRCAAAALRMLYDRR